MKVIKKLPPLFLLAVFIMITFKFLLFTSYEYFHKASFRKQLIEQEHAVIFNLKIPSNEFLIDKPGFEWMDDGEELIINGVYHEVVKIKDQGSFTLVSLIEDAEENELFRKYFYLNKNVQNGYFELMELLLDLEYINQKINYNLQTYFINNKNGRLEIIFHDFDFPNKIIKPPRILVV